MTNPEHLEREQIFSDKLKQLRESAQAFSEAATWLIEEFHGTVQKPNLNAAIELRSQGKYKEADLYLGESWYDRLSADEYKLLKELAQNVASIYPEAAVEAVCEFLGHGIAAEYFELKISELGYRKITFK